MWAPSDNSWWEKLLDIVFPPRCVGCRRLGSWICQDCRGRIEIIKTPICYKCRQLSAGFKICPTCRRTNPALNKVIMCSYWQSPLKEMVYGLKYYQVRSAADVLGNWLANVAASFCGDVDLLVVPVPLHRWRLWNRGFNQSELLAKVVAERLNRPLIRALVRQKPTKPQFGLNKADRQKNMQGVFDISTRYQPLVAGKTVLLVDDIVTTGATLNECAKILKQNGVREVWGLVLAKA